MARTVTGQDGSRTAGSSGVVDAEKEYDVLTFFSQFTSVLGYKPSTTTELYLLMLFPDNLALHLPRPQARFSGGTSQVTIMDSQGLIARGIYTPPTPMLPEKIAVKMAKPGVLQGRSNIDRALLRSMATELRILSDKTIRSHDNIITLLGTCWERTASPDDAVLPVFVFETSELGDLQHWLPENDDIALGIQLDMCLGLTRGVACLHEAGVVHCDLKPANVIVFRQSNPQSPFILKIIDFNIAIVAQDVSENVPLPEGTPPWNSPEQMVNTMISRADLPKVDIYSLGTLLLHILTAGQSITLISFIAARGVQGLSLTEFKQSGALALNVLNYLDKFGQVSGPEGDNTYFANFRHCWIRATLMICGTLAGDLRDRTGSVAKVVDDMEKLCVVAQEYGLRDYRDPNLRISKMASETFRISINPGKCKLRV
jgi:serine/threonine protein kinase